MQIHRKVS